LARPKTKFYLIRGKKRRVFFARGISPDQKSSQTLLGRGIACSQWEGPSMHSRCLAFSLFKFGGEGRILFIFPSFPMCSHYVPFKFSMGSQHNEAIPSWPFKYLGTLALQSFPLR